MPVIRELLVAAGIKVDQRAIDRYDKSIASLKKQMGVLAGVAVGAGVALFAAAKATAKAGDEAAKQSARLGVSVEAYQELAFAAELSGTAIGTIQLGMKGLGRLVGDFERGTSTAKDTVLRLGVSFRDADGKMRPIPALLEDIADRFAGMENGLEKSDLAQRAFSRGGADMINFLNAGGAGIRAMRLEARELGFVLDATSTKEAEEFNDNMSRMKFALLGVRNTIGKALIPIITQVSAKLIGWWKINRKLVQAKVKEWAESVVKGLKAMVRWLTRVADKLGPVIDDMGGFGAVLGKVVKAILIFQAAKFVVTLVQVAAALKAMGLAAALASAKIALIALIVAGAALVIEDLITFVEGGDSAMGRFAKSAEGAGGFVGGLGVALKELREALGGLPADMDRAKATFKQPLGGDLNWFESALGSIRRFSLAVDQAVLVRFPAAVKSMVVTLSAFIHAVFDTIISKIKQIPAALMRAVSGARGIGSSIVGGVSGVLNTPVASLFGSASPQAQAGRTPAAATAGGGGINAGGINVTVHAPSPGASPEEIGRATQQGVETALQKMLRGVAQNASGGEL